MRRITWIIVAQSAEIRIFKHHKIGEAVELIRSFDNPEGRLKNQEIVSDRQGSSREGGAATPHSFSPEVDPATKLLEGFVKEFLQFLDLSAYKNEFDNLVLAASPRILGMLQSHLGSHAKSKLTGTINKDLSHLRDAEIVRQVGTVMAV